jgi:hopene-associated glycosyltransferase HpnB
MIWVTLLAAIALGAWVYLVGFHGRFWLASERLAATPAPAAWPAVAVVIPARNEAVTIGATLESLLAQDYPGDLLITLVDDSSSDGTGDIGRDLAAGTTSRVRLSTITGQPLASGWTGKLWALHQGVSAALAVAPDTRFVLFTDADIVHPPDLVRDLVAKAEAERRDLVSLMVRLNCVTPWERVLIPAFVFFFQKLYPFPAVNDPKSKVAGAAGGCMLIRRAMLERIGGVAAIRGALIDDCALARALKSAGGNLWLGLADKSRSLRAYDRLSEIWSMVARSAYTQLNYSPLLLLGTVIGMVLLYLVPIIVVLSWPLHQDPVAGVAALIALVLSLIAYVPTLRYYGEPASAAALLPLAAALYLAMTVDSARRHWQGRGGQWKGRYAPGGE